MNKILLSFLACFSVSVLMSAATVDGTANRRISSYPLADGRVMVGPAASQFAKSGIVKAPALLESESQTLRFSLAGEPYSAVALNSVGAGAQFANAFQMSAFNVGRFAGNEITSVNICTGVNSSTKRNRITSVTIFITYDLEADPVYTQDCTLGTDAYTYYDIPLNTPFPIEAGKEFFVGYYGKRPTSYDYYAPVDYLEHSSDDGGWMASKSGSKWSWANISSEVGFVCLGATISGNSLPVDQMSVDRLSCAFSVVRDEPFVIEATVNNQASNDIENFEISYQVGTDEPVVRTIQMEEPLAYGSPVVIEIDGVVSSQSAISVPVKMSITKVNGVDNDYIDNSAKTKVMCLEPNLGFDRNLVIEEGTGTWCGYCPTGISTMEYIRDTYTDGSFIPIAVHNGDPMACNSYNSLFSAYIPGLPGAVINRTNSVDPRDRDEVLRIYDYYAASQTYAGVEATCAFDDDMKNLTFNTVTKFGFDLSNSADRYRLSFVVTEDGVGPYYQENYYSGASGNYYGWESKPSKVSMRYNDVARDIFTYAGIAKSIPAAITAGEAYSYSYQVTLSSSKVADASNVNAIVLLVNKSNDEIVNAVMLRPSQIATSGIESVLESAESVTVSGSVGAVEIAGDCNRVEVFSVSGMKVADVKSASRIEVPAGLYIVKVDGMVRKVLVR